MLSALKRRIKLPAWVVIGLAALVVIFATTGGANGATEKVSQVVQSITGRDIKDGSLTGRDIKNGSISRSDLSRAVRSELARIQGDINTLKRVRTTAGPSGPAGAAGAKGDTGVAGQSGRDGRDGIDGRDGLQGRKGDPGQNGRDGQNGVDGRDGVNGIDGIDGAPGTPGQNGADGRDGRDGDPGQNGQDGAPGPQLSSGNWGIIDRNTVGGGDASLRSGPSGVTGSLHLSVPTNRDKVSYGNEDDFRGDPLSAINAVGFRVFTTGENSVFAPDGNNMPGISLEVNPGINGSGGTPITYTTITFVPGSSSPVNQWSGYIDATSSGRWVMSGAAGIATGCRLGSIQSCSWDQVKDVVPNATLSTVAVTKGTDYPWHGSIDSLTFGPKTYDFDETGVFERPTQ